MGEEREEPDLETAGDATAGYTSVPGIEEWSTLSTSDSFYQMLGRFNVEAFEPVLLRSVIHQLSRQAALESIALEGFLELRPGESRTVAAQSEDWENVFSGKAPSSRRLFSAHLEALEYATGYDAESMPVTEIFIRDLHSKACLGQDAHEVLVSDGRGGYRSESRPLQTGRYKELQNDTVKRDGSVHPYSTPTDTPIEMAYFVEQLNSATFKELDPIIKIAYAHYCLVHIHPFADGNGRVARILASMYSVAHFGVPLLVFADRKNTYFQALEGANAGNYSEFVEYTYLRTIDTMAHAMQEIKYRTTPSVSERLSALADYSDRYAELSIEAAKSVVERMGKEVHEEIQRRVEDAVDQSGSLIRGSITPYAATLGTASYQSVQYSSYSEIYKTLYSAEITLTSTAVTEVAESMRISIGLSEDLSTLFPIQLVAAKGSGYPDRDSGVVQLSYEDCVPDMGTGASERMKLLVHTAIGDILERIAIEVEKILRKTGNLKR